MLWKPFRRNRAISAVADRSGSDHRYRLEIWKGELADTIKMAKWSAIAHLLTATHLIVLWKGQPQPFLSIFLGSIVLIILAGIVTARAYGRSNKGEAAVRRARRRAACLAALLSTSWGVAAITLGESADADRWLILTLIITGLVPDAFIVGPIWIVSVSLTLPMVTGALVTLFRNGQPASLDSLPLLVMYTGFILLGVRLRGQHTSERILERLRVADQKDTIALLLNDFQEGTSDWLWETDVEGRLEHVSPGPAEALGAESDRLKSARLADYLDRGDGAGIGRAGLTRLLDERTAFRDYLVEASFTGGTRWWRLSGKPKFDAAGSFIGFRGVGSDVTGAKTAQDQVVFLANYDSLTGAANRNLFQKRLEAELDGTARAGAPFSLLLIDIDDFKVINDTFGHGAGDALLTALADRFRQSAGAEAYVARLGGDEFAIILPGMAREDAFALANRLIAKSGSPLLYQDAKLEIGLSIGLSTVPEDAADPETLLKRADLALYDAKAKGKGRVAVFEAALEAEVIQRRRMERDLGHALAKGELEVVYQPILGSQSGRVTCCEALLRWNRAGFGPVSPAIFIPAAEATGEILRIGAWVLRTACFEAAKWPRHIRLAVNLSIVQARSADLLEIVERALLESGLDPDRLELEITESVFLEMTAVTERNLAGLRALGIRIALDDFGTGYSSLSYLLKLSVDKLKIDRSFIQACTEGREGRAVVDSIIQLAKTLGMIVTAEGIETEMQADYVRLQGCHEMQGFLFSKPVSAQLVGIRIDGEREAARPEPGLLRLA